MSDQLEKYLAAERAKGLSDEAIRQELLSKGWDPIIVHRAMQPAAAVAEQSPHRLSGSLILLIAGLSLILIAAISFFGSSWPELSALGRFLVIAIPNGLLFLIGSSLAKGEDLKLIKEATHTTGHVLVPVTIGVFLYQFGFYDQTDALLLAYSTLLALPLYVYVAWYKKYSYGFALIMLASAATALFLLSDNLLDGWRSSLIVTLLGLLATQSGYRQKKLNQKTYLPGLISTGVVLLIVGWSSVVDDGLRLLFGDETLIIMLAALLTGGGLLVGAAALGKLFQPWTRLELWHQRAMAGIGVVLAFIILLSGAGQAALLAMVALIFAATVIIIGLENRVRFLTWLGLMGGVISTLNLLFVSIDRVTIIILTFVLGFGAVLLSIVLTRRHATLARPTAPSEPGWRIGLIDDKTASRLSVTTGEAPTFLLIVVRIILVFVLWFLLQFIISSTIDRQSPPWDGGSPVESVPAPFI